MTSTFSGYLTTEKGGCHLFPAFRPQDSRFSPLSFLVVSVVGAVAAEESELPVAFDGAYVRGNDQFHTLTVRYSPLQSRSKLNRFLIKSGRGLGPMTPQQPARQANLIFRIVALRFGAKSRSKAFDRRSGKIRRAD